MQNSKHNSNVYVSVQQVEGQNTNTTFLRKVNVHQVDVQNMSTVGLTAREFQAQPTCQFYDQVDVKNMSTISSVTGRL